MTGPVLRVEAWRSVPGMRPVRESYAFRTVDRRELRGSRLVAAALPPFADPAAVRRFLAAVVTVDDAARLQSLLDSTAVRARADALLAAATRLDTAYAQQPPSPARRQPAGVR